MRADRARTLECKPPKEESVACSGTRQSGSLQDGGAATYQAVIGDGRQDDAHESHNEVSLAKKRYGLLGRTILQGDQEVFSLCGDESEQLPDHHLRIAAEGDDCVGDELQRRQ